MIIVSYDFASDRRRAKFYKFLKKYGRRIQYSVFELKNSPRILQNILNEVKYKYDPFFTKEDSILIYQIGDCCVKKISRYGYPANEEDEVVYFE